MVNKDKQILTHIYDYCQTIGELIDRFGEDFSEFVADKAYYNAVSMCILQIGELSGKLSDEFRTETGSRIPWKTIRGMRNLFAHAYGSMDDEVIWETVINDIPALQQFCRGILERESVDADAPAKSKHSRDER